MEWGKIEVKDIIGWLVDIVSLITFYLECRSNKKEKGGKIARLEGRKIKNYEILNKMYKENYDKAINTNKKFSKLSNKALEEWEKGNKEIIKETNRIIEERKKNICPNCQKNFTRREKFER